MRIITGFFVAAVLLSACAKWQDPSTSIISTDKSIVVLLLNPSVYTMQKVRVKGKVWEISETKEPTTPTTFKLADGDGNYITVVWEKELTFKEHDRVEASGLFDSNFIPEENRFNPLLSAETVRVLKFPKLSR